MPLHFPFLTTNTKPWRYQAWLLGLLPLASARISRSMCKIVRRPKCFLRSVWQWRSPLSNEEPLQIMGKVSWKHTRDQRVIMSQKWHLWEKALNILKEAPASTSKSYRTGNHRMFGHFGACGSDVLSQALTYNHKRARWPGLPNKITFWLGLYSDTRWGPPEHPIPREISIRKQWE